MLLSPVQMTIFMVVAVLLAFGVCVLGLQNGVERITKVMMILLICLMIVLAVHSLLLPNMQEGLAFYLIPDISKICGDWLRQRSVCSHVACVLYFERRHWLDGDFRQLFGQIQTADRRSTQRNGIGHVCRSDGGHYHHSGVLCIRRAAGFRSVFAVYHAAECL